MNILINTDSYKASHWKQYPPKTEKIYSYLESRGGEYNYTVFFGLQYFLLRHLVGQVVTQEKIDCAAKFWQAHFGRSDCFNREGWEYILKKYDGKLPLLIKAVPEGSVIPLKNILMSIENTDPNCYWLTNWVETLAVQLWYPITIATNSRAIKETISQYAKETGADLNGVNFKLHDFGFRGVSSFEEAMIGGMAHLVNFLGTDTTPGIQGAMEYYDSEMCGFSIPASEHSTITSWGKEHELDAFRNMLEQYPSGLIACVSDSYDIFKATEEYWGSALKDRVLNRDGCLVIRPDSGDPIEVVIRVLLTLQKCFGGTYNDKGYFVLDPHVRVIQGDGIDSNMVRAILAAMQQHKFSVDNIAFGSGGGLLRKFDRDTMKFAFKCSSAVIDGQEYDVWKDPVTSVTKKSKRGRLKLVNERTIHTVQEKQSSSQDMLRPVFLDGELLIRDDFETIRSRAIL